MTQFTATIHGGSATDQEFVSTAFFEATKWFTPILLGSGILDFDLELGPLPGSTIAQTGGMAALPAPAAPGVYEPGTVTELRTGVDPNGAEPDAYTYVDVSKLAREPNAIVDMMHEIVHALAFNGGGLGSDMETLFDAQTNGWYFIGEFAMGVYGGPIQLSADRHHILAFDLMYPTANIAGCFPLSDLDVAILADSGVPVVHTWEPSAAIGALLA